MAGSSDQEKPAGRTPGGGRSDYGKDFSMQLKKKRRTREHLSSANHKTEKELYDMWMDLEVQGTMSAGFRCTKCAESRDLYPSSYTFMYDCMRKHVFEHGRGDHTICEACSFFAGMQGQRPILKTRDHISSISHKHESCLFA